MKLIKDLGVIYTSNTKKYKHRFGIFECPLCQKHFKAQTTHINQKNIQSCGCIKKINCGHRTHNKSNKSRLYQTWKNMRQRCKNKNISSYKNYGGRGISICRQWDDFEKFESWALSNGYRDNLTIDRVDNDGDYEPDNCRWATRQEQADNKRELRLNNTSGVKGLNFCRRGKVWVVRVTKDNKRISLGRHKNKKDAINKINNFRANNGTK